MAAIEQDTEKALSSNSSQDGGAKDPNIVDFEGPDDPMNALNWSFGKKTAQMLIITIMTMLSPTASTICAAATPDILKHFNSTNKSLGTLVTTIFVFGYTFGPMAIAPLSEIYGRAIMYKICMVFFVVFNVACAVANSLGSLIVFRFLAGVMGSCPITIGAGSIVDIVVAEKRAALMGAYSIGIVLGPAVGPIAGGFLSPAAGWRWIFWVVAIAGGVVAVFAILLLDESYPFTLLERKARRLRKETGNLDLRSALDTGRTPRDLVTFSIIRPLKMLLSPIIFSLCLYAATMYGYLYLCLTTFDTVYTGQYGFNTGEAGLSNLGLAVGSVLSCVLYPKIGNGVSERLAKKHGGIQKPEYRLPPMIFGGVFVPIGLFWYGWSAHADAHWIVPIIGTAVLAVGIFFIFVPVQMYLVDAYSVYSASVTAATVIVRCLFGGLLPLAGSPMFDALGLGWGNSLLGFIAIGFFPVPIVLYLYGERMRNSKFFKKEF